MSKQTQSHKSINHDESSIIAAILRGDRGLFHDLIHPYESSAYIMAFYLLRDEADAEDAVLKAFLSAFHDLGTFHVESSFSTWLMSIVLNEVRIQQRKKKGMQTDSIDAGREGETRLIMLAERENLRQNPALS